MTVNVRWYLKQDALLDMTVSPAPDHYLVMTGPRATLEDAATRPWRISTVCLFDDLGRCRDLSEGSVQGAGPLPRTAPSAGALLMTNSGLPVRSLTPT